MTDTTAPRTPRIRIESDGTVRSGGATRVLVDGVDLSRFITDVDVTWRIGAHRDRNPATATIEFLDGVELRTSAMPAAETALVLQKLQPEILRRQAAWLTSDGHYRPVLTDSESADGVALRCTSPRHPEEDRERQWEVHDCCDHTVVEMRHEKAAAFYVDALALLPALLDERERYAANLAGLNKQAAADTAALNNAYRERAHLVALLAAQYPAQLRHDPHDPDYSIVYVQLPTGQASWHISDRDIDLFPHVESGPYAEWDGHTTEGKYDRVAELRRRIAGETRDHPMIVVLADDGVRHWLPEAAPARKERDEDARAVAAVIAAIDAFWSSEASTEALAGAREALYARYADRIADVRRRDAGETGRKDPK